MVKIKNITFILLSIVCFLYLLPKISSAQIAIRHEDACFELLKERAPKINLEIPFADYEEFSQNAEIYKTYSNIIGSNPSGVSSDWIVYMFGNTTKIPLLSNISYPKEKMIIFYYDKDGFEGCGGFVFYSGTTNHPNFNYTDKAIDGKIFTMNRGIRNMPSSYYADYYIFVSKDSPKYVEHQFLVIRGRAMQMLKDYIFVVLFGVAIIFIIIVRLFKKSRNSR